jgi:hypothetical protein
LVVKMHTKRASPPSADGNQCIFFHLKCS